MGPRNKCRLTGLARWIRVDVGMGMVVAVDANRNIVATEAEAPLTAGAKLGKQNTYELYNAP